MSWIEMTVYNKLKIAILALCSSQSLHAITIDPIQIESTPGELLYAEMNFRQSDVNSKLEVSLAAPEDLMAMGIIHQPPSHLNFFTRRNSNGEGTIVITSSRPMLESELNIVVKIKEGNATRLQHVKTKIQPSRAAELSKLLQEKPLIPQTIISERDIALNLPESTQYTVSSQSNHPAAEPSTPYIPDEYKALAIHSRPPEPLNPAQNQSTAAQTKSVNQNIASPTQDFIPPKKQQSDGQSVSTTPQTQVTPNTTPQVATKPEEKISEKPQPSNSSAKNASTPTAHRVEKKERKTERYQYQVEKNDSLWSIAQRISKQTNQPLQQVMREIQAQNAHAFIQGNAHQIKYGAQLKLNTAIPVGETKKQKEKQQASSSANSSQSGKAKYRLKQAEMSLVAESQGESTTGKNKKGTAAPAEFVTKVMSTREKTLSLQQNVTQLELSLRQKEQRITLLNAKLAQLQERLKAQQQKISKTSH